MRSDVILPFGMIHTDRFATWQSMPRHGLYVVLFNTAIAVLLTVVDYRGSGFAHQLVYSFCIGMPAWLFADGGRRILWPDRRAPMLPFAMLLAGSMLLAWLGGTSLAAMLLGHPWRAEGYMASLLIAVPAGFVAMRYFWERERMAKLEAEAAREKGRSEAIERQVAEGRLKLLQAQIEPHFLFNTLANLDALIGIDPARARVMLGHLNDYLRATLASARKERNTLGDEFALLAGYLEVIGVRMGARLSFSLDLPEALKGIEIPPMLLQPLVENAIKHGLEPKLDGGRIEIAARADGTRLVITVADTGIGLGGNQVPGTRLGLENVRERIAAAYGSAAALEVGAPPAGGVTVTLSIPREPK